MTVAIWLVNTGGANWKVLIAVWLWMLPAVGLFGGLGYAVGRLVDVLTHSSAALSKER
jgi:hypothetical protein